MKVADNAGFDRYFIFHNCIFLNDAVANTMTSAFVIPSGMGSATHRIVLKDCGVLGAGEVDSNNRGIVYLNTGTITGGGNSGLFLVSNTT